MSADAALQDVLYSVQGSTATLTLNRPDAGNALSVNVMRNLSASIEAARKDDQVALLVLRSNGRNFCAGADLSWISALVSREQSIWNEGTDALLNLFDQLHAFEKPVVARVHGAVVGAGIGLVCLCDVVLAADTTRWHLPEMQLGMVPTAVLPPLMHRVPPAGVRRLLYASSRVDGATALSLGLASDLVPEASLDSALAHTVNTWLSVPRTVLADTKRLTLQLEGDTFGQRLAAMRPLAHASFHSSEAQQHLSAALQSRPS